MMFSYVEIIFFVFLWTESAGFTGEVHSVLSAPEAVLRLKNCVLNEFSALDIMQARETCASNRFTT